MATLHRFSVTANKKLRFDIKRFVSFSYQFICPPDLRNSKTNFIAPVLKDTLILSLFRFGATCARNASRGAFPKAAREVVEAHGYFDLK